MARTAMTIAGPVYLFACLTLGGSSQGVWTNLILQIAGATMIAVTAIAWRPLEGSGARRLGWIAIAALALLLLHLLPLPPGVWTGLAGRGPIAEGFALLGAPLPWMPLSMAPYSTLFALLALLPGAAMLLWALRWWDGNAWSLPVAVLAGTVASAAAGLLQFGSDEPWYPYRYSNFGAVTGLFANSNHFASLLLCAIPMVAALAAIPWSKTSVQRSGAQRLAIAAAVMLCAAAVATGIALNGSLAVTLLSGPMLIASALILLPSVAIRLGRLAALIGFAVLAAGAVVVAFGADSLARLGSAASVGERWDILSRSSRMVGEYAPLGSGFGTFAETYRLHEEPDLVNWIHVNHVHNDYVELIVELGVPGALLLASFLLWWSWRFLALWGSSGTAPVVRAATLVTLGLLLHSLVDFPLRTAALSALFAASLGIMALPSRGVVRREGGQPRHLTLEDL